MKWKFQRPEWTKIGETLKDQAQFWLNCGHYFVNNDTSGFTSNTLLKHKQDLLMVNILYRFNNKTIRGKKIKAMIAMLPIGQLKLLLERLSVKGVGIDWIEPPK